MSDRDIERRTRELRSMVFEETKERCARVVEACLKDGYRPGERIAAAIRALKDKP